MHMLLYTRIPNGTYLIHIGIPTCELSSYKFSVSGDVSETPFTCLLASLPAAVGENKVDHLSANCFEISVTDDGGSSSSIELVAFGNPHLSLDECAKLASLMTQAPEKDPKVKVMATLSRHVYDLAKEHGHVGIMESFGVQFINDTC